MEHEIFGDEEYPGLSIHSSHAPYAHHSDDSDLDLDLTPRHTPRSSPQPDGHHGLFSTRTSLRKGTPMPKFEYLSSCEEEDKTSQFKPTRQNIGADKTSLSHCLREDDLYLDEGESESEADFVRHAQPRSRFFSPRLDSMLAHVLFQNNKTHFYHVTTTIDTLTDAHSSPGSLGNKYELNCLVEQCFMKKIDTDLIFLIIYSRKKYDDMAKRFSIAVLNDPSTDFKRLSQDDHSCVTS